MAEMPLWEMPPGGPADVLRLLEAKGFTVGQPAPDETYGGESATVQTRWGPVKVRFFRDVVGLTGPLTWPWRWRRQNRAFETARIALGQCCRRVDYQHDVDG